MFHFQMSSFHLFSVNECICCEREVAFFYYVFRLMAHLAPKVHYRSKNTNNIRLFSYCQVVSNDHSMNYLKLTLIFKGKFKVSKPIANAVKMIKSFILFTFCC